MFFVFFLDRGNPLGWGPLEGVVFYIFSYKIFSFFELTRGSRDERAGNEVAAVNSRLYDPANALLKKITFNIFLQF